MIIEVVNAVVVVDVDDAAVVVGVAKHSVRNSASGKVGAPKKLLRHQINWIVKIVANAVASICKIKKSLMLHLVL